MVQCRYAAGGWLVSIFLSLVYGGWHYVSNSHTYTWYWTFINVTPESFNSFNREINFCDSTQLFMSFPMYKLYNTVK